MRSFAVAVGLSALILVISVVCCTPSLHPLYTEDDLVQEPALLGTWLDVAEDEGVQIWTFSESDGSHYWLEHTDLQGHAGRFYAHMVKLGDELFLDLYPDEMPSQMNTLYGLHLVPAHTFLHVPRVEPELVLAYFNPDWVSEYLAEHPDEIAHEYVGQDEGTVVLTALTPALQAFVLAHLGDEEAFIPEDGMERAPEGWQPPAPEEEAAAVADAAEATAAPAETP